MENVKFLTKYQFIVPKMDLIYHNSPKIILPLPENLVKNRVKLKKCAIFNPEFQTRF